MGHTIKPSVHAHLDSYRRPLDGKSKFCIRVDIGGNKKLYPIDTQGDQELYMDRKYWVNEKCPDTGKKLKKKRIQHTKGNGDSKNIERILNSKINCMDKLINKLGDADKTVTVTIMVASVTVATTLLTRFWKKTPSGDIHLNSTPIQECLPPRQLSNFHVSIFLHSSTNPIPTPMKNGSSTPWP